MHPSFSSPFAPSLGKTTGKVKPCLPQHMAENSPLFQCKRESEALKCNAQRLDAVNRWIKYQHPSISMSWQHGPSLTLHQLRHLCELIYQNKVVLSGASELQTQRSLLGAKADERTWDRESGISVLVVVNPQPGSAGCGKADGCCVTKLFAQGWLPAPVVALSVSQRHFQKHSWCWYRFARLQPMCHFSINHETFLKTGLGFSGFCLGQTDLCRSPSYY